MRAFAYWGAGWICIACLDEFGSVGRRLDSSTLAAWPRDQRVRGRGRNDSSNRRMRPRHGLNVY